MYTANTLTNGTNPARIKLEVIKMEDMIEFYVNQAKELKADITQILYWVVQAQKVKIDIEKVLECVCHKSNPECQPDVSLATQDIIRALQREQKLLTSFRDRKQYPHLRGGRPKRVAFYVEFAGIVGKDKALIRAAGELSQRSLFRLKRLLA